MKKLSTFFCMALTSILIVGCSAGNQSEGDESSDSSLLGLDLFNDFGDGSDTNYYVNGGKNFVPAGNPLIDNDSIRNSSDPAICVYKHPNTGSDVLMMVTSCDMKDVTIPDANFNYYPMNTTYLYTISPDGKWYDHGGIVQENDFAWAKHDVNHLWAPDIQYVPGTSTGNGKFYLYVPAVDKTDGRTQRIGIAIAPEKTATTAGGKIGLCGKFVPQPDYLKISNAADGTPPPNGAFAYDPGIEKIGTNYYMSYCDEEHSAGRINIAKMNSDMKSAQYIGKIKFKGDPTDPESGRKLNDMYMEGPDLSVFTVGRGTQIVYLILAAKNVDGTERIGYATQFLSDFNASDSNKTNNWSFRGWIIQGVLGQSDDASHWTDHADFCQYNGKYYIFYHKIVDPLNRSQNRQACAEEIFLKSDGDIQYRDTNGDLRNVPLPGSSDGPFVDRLKCEWAGNYLTVTGVYNYPIAACQTRNNDWDSQKWTVENVSDGSKRLRNNWSGYYLTTIGNKDYAEVVCMPLDPANGSEQKWILENDSSGGKRLKNKYSGKYLTVTGTIEGAVVACQPYDNTWASQVWILDGNRFKNQWSSKDLACTGNIEGATVRVQPFDESWKNEVWATEIVEGLTYVRLRSSWSGRYLTASGSIDGAPVVCKYLDTADKNQQWEKALGSSSGNRRLRNVGTNNYLTIRNGSVYSDVVTQPLHLNGGNPDWVSQVWWFK